jgi:hypothetical protein
VSSIWQYCEAPDRLSTLSLFGGADFQHFKLAMNALAPIGIKMGAVQ